jgi:probable rRNA maturation factor
VLARRVGRTLRAAGLVGVELSLTLSDDRELHALNRWYADEDHATDVLSFAQAEGAIVAPSTGRRPLGDVIISVEYAARQATAQGRTLPGELFHLAVHGLVHLLGYDHRDAREERVMFGYEAALRGAALARGPIRRVAAPRD